MDFCSLSETNIYTIIKYWLHASKNAWNRRIVYDVKCQIFPGILVLISNYRLNASRCFCFWDKSHACVYIKTKLCISHLKNPKGTVHTSVVFFKIWKVSESSDNFLFWRVRASSHTNRGHNLTVSFGRHRYGWSSALLNCLILWNLCVIASYPKGRLVE